MTLGLLPPMGMNLLSSLRPLVRSQRPWSHRLVMPPLRCPMHTMDLVRHQSEKFRPQITFPRIRLPLLTSCINRQGRPSCISFSTAAKAPGPRRKSSQIKVKRPYMRFFPVHAAPHAHRQRLPKPNLTFVWSHKWPLNLSAPQRTLRTMP